MPRDFQWSGFSSFSAMRTRVKHAQQRPEMPRDFQWSSLRSFPAMRTRVKLARKDRKCRAIFQWSGFSSFLAMRTRVKHVHRLEMPCYFLMVWFQIFSRHADTCQARTRTANAAQFPTVLFSTFPISMRKVSRTFTDQQCRTIFSVR
jgi:hypothetical protein